MKRQVTVYLERELFPNGNQISSNDLEKIIEIKVEKFDLQNSILKKYDVILGKLNELNSLEKEMRQYEKIKN